MTNVANKICHICSNDEKMPLGSSPYPPLGPLERRTGSNLVESITTCRIEPYNLGYPYLVMTVLMKMVEIKREGLTELRHLPHDHILLKRCVHNIPEASNVFGLVKFQFEEHVEEWELLKQNKNLYCNIILSEVK